MHNSASVQENDTRKLLLNFDMHTDHLISARTPDVIVINNKNNNKKRTCKIVDLAIPSENRKKKLNECENKDKYPDLAQDLIKLWKLMVTIMPIVISAFSTVTKGLLKGLEDIEWRPSKLLHY